MVFTFESIDDSTSRISGYTLPIKELIKSHKGKYEPASKSWIVPRSEIARLKSDIQVYENRERMERERKWSKALEQCGHKFVQKGSSAYDEVLAVYKCI